MMSHERRRLGDFEQPDDGPAPEVGPPEPEPDSPLQALLNLSEEEGGFRPMDEY